MATDGSRAPDAFDAESERLRDLIGDAGGGADLPVSEIVRIYYQVISVSSMAAALRQQLGAGMDGALRDRIAGVEAMISERFDSEIHPRIMRGLADSIRKDMDSLERDGARGGDAPSREDVEGSAGRYEELRQKMSTEEFVRQYEMGLHA